MANFGDIISFNYPAIHKEGTRAHDPNPKVLVLHPNFGGHMHGLKIDSFSPQELNMLRMLINPAFEKQYKASLTRESPDTVKEFDRIIKTASTRDITSPQQFYTEVIKPIIKPRGYQPYRQYTVSKVRGTFVIERATMTATAQGPTPFQSYAKRTKGFRGPQLPNRAPNFKKGVRAPNFKKNKGRR